LHMFLLSHEFYLLCPYHPPSFHHPNNIWLWMLILKLLFMPLYASQHKKCHLMKSKSVHSNRFLNKRHLLLRYNRTWRTGRTFIQLPIS
jgi:hypothetical protein